MSRTALLILNKKSKRGRDLQHQAIACLEQQGLRIEPIESERPQDIPNHIAHFRTGIDLIVVAGGDGTLNAALPGLMEADLPFGILPLGTANDLARTLNIPEDIQGACSAITNGRLRRIDVSRVNDCLFFNVANIGLGVRVGLHLSSEAKRRWGIFGYIQAVSMALRYNRPFTAQLTCDGQVFKVKSIQIGVGGGRFYGGGTAIREDADIDDGKLNLYSLKPMSLWRLIALAPALRAGRQQRFDDVIPMQGRSISVKTTPPLTVNADGEPITQTPANFSIVEGALSVYVPYSNQPA